MATITEDFVSFEVAKLLKDKRFDEECWYWYEEDGYFIDSNDDYGFQSNSDHISNDFICSAPTQAVAMKWLREVHNLSVEIYRTACGYIGCIVAIPSGTDIKFLEEDGDDLPSGQYTTWDRACEAAIKYCLENLI